MSAGGSAADEARRARERALEHRRKAMELERRAQAFEAGHVGELAVARALESLSAHGYHRLDDVRFPGTQRSNIDHVLVGPGGLFVIDAKEWSGRVEIKGGELRQNGRRRTKQVETVENALAAVLRSSRLQLRRATPVICLTGTGQAAGYAAGVTVLSVHSIAAWIEAHPSVMTEDEVRTSFEALRVNLRDAAPQAVTSAPVRRRTPRPSARQPSNPSGGPAASWVPDFVPDDILTSPPPGRRGGRAGALPRRHRLPRGLAIAGRLLLLMWILGAAIAMAEGRDVVHNAIMGGLWIALLVVLERRRAVLRPR